MFFVVQSNDSFNFPLGLIKYIVIVRVLSNILGWHGGNSSKQVRLIPMHASRHDSVILAQPTHAHYDL